MEVTRPCRQILFALSLFIWSTPAPADVHFVAAPDVDSRINDTGSGTRERPWASIDEALTSGHIQSGDELRLLSGDFGDMIISNATFDEPVTIEPDDGARVHVTSLSIKRSRNLLIRGLQVWTQEPLRGFAVQTDGKSSLIVFQNLDIRSREDAENYPQWSREDWLTWRRTGIILRGPDNAILDSTFTGMAFAIGATGPRNRIEGNVVRGFSGDGARVLGDGSVFRGNRIEDCVQVNNNHADGFQSWSRGPKGESGKGTVHGLTISHNIIREWAHPTVSPLRCSLQGIGMFDGMFEDITIENNFVQVSAPHGIAVVGARRVSITHNTVINNRTIHKKFPWIRLGPHKNGTPSTDGTIANNIATGVSFIRKPEFRITASGNLTGMAPARIFMDPAKGDFRPRPGGPAEGKGDPAQSLPVDLFGAPRDAAPDIGAIEFR